MNTKASIVVVEDDRSLSDIAAYQLEKAGYAVTLFISAESAWEHIKNTPPDLVLTDLILDGNWHGDELLRRCQALDKDVPVILMTANGSIENAVACLHQGATTYLTKPFRWDEMLHQVKKALELHLATAENQRLRLLVQSYSNYDALVGESKPMLHLKEEMHRMATSHAPVLILGESGTGKELVARSLHLSSHRKDGPFIAVNCGAIVPTLAESEFFGHCKGAFTGASQDKKGFFVQAHGGTLFLDEIGEMPLDLQVKILRVIQDGEVLPVGGHKNIPVKIRLICATHVDLSEAVQNGEFREDLFYRIAVLPLKVPSLRERREDIVLLAEYFLKQQNIHSVKILPRLANKLMHQPWPGNIRQLQNAMIRMAVLNPEVVHFDLEHWPMVSDSNLAKTSETLGGGEILQEGFQLEQHVRDLVELALEKNAGNQTHAARQLGITRSALIYRMQKYGLAHGEV